ncbi:MAG: TPM domain-containing protein [Sphingobacteriaceae bacterium]
MNFLMMSLSAMRTKMMLKKYLLFLLLCLPGWLAAQNFPERPNRLVNDYTQTLNSDEVNALEQKLVAFDDSTSNQIAVVLVPSLEGYDVADYAQRLAEKWGIGGQKKNNGIILLASIGDRKVTIQTGYGLEGAVPDAIARRIIEIAIKPNFKEGNYYRGLEQGTDALIAYTKGEYKAEPRKDKSFPIGMLIIIGIIILVVASSIGKGGNGQVIGGRGSSIPFWLLMMGGNGGGGYSGGSSSGGGGFGGFGGGSFGGGGASGSW